MVLVTGATGIVGSHIVAKLLAENQKVRVLLRKSSQRDTIALRVNNGALLDTIEWAEGDVGDPVSLDAAMRGISDCYHCAALVSFSDKVANEMYETNVAGTENVVNAALRHQVTLCYISSTAALGDEVIDGERSEKSKWTSDKGKSPYSLSKRYAELAVFRGVEEGLDAIVLNPGIVIGPGKWGTSSTTLVTNAAKGMRFYPSGENGFVDPRDIADIGFEMMKEPRKYNGQHILVAENTSFQNLFTKIAAAAGVRKPSIPAPIVLLLLLKSVLQVFEFVGLGFKGLSSRNLQSALSVQHFSNKKIKDLGFSFRPLSETIQSTVDAYLAG